MLIQDCMTRHPILIPPTLSATEAQKILTDNHIRHLPVVEGGKRLVGLVTRQQLLLKADAIGNLSMWEIARFLNDLRVSQVMVRGRGLVTATADLTIERAAQIMTQRKISCLPVLAGASSNSDHNAEAEIVENTVIGIVTETDLLRAFQEMLGLHGNGSDGSANRGVRVTVRIPDRTGELAKLMQAAAQHKWNVVGIGTFPTRRRANSYDAVIKIAAVTIPQVSAVFAAIPGQEIVDIRNEE